MRIISGIYKGRVIKSPSGKDEVRPTTDRAKETLFNILTNRFDLEEKECLDLFCGTGNIGFEFLSRGGRSCTFVDFNIKTVKDNTDLLDTSGKSRIIKSEVLRFLSGSRHLKFDFAFADPPYKYDNFEKLLEEISAYKLIFILEHGKNFIVPKAFIDKLFLNKKIGISNFSFFDFN